jgi:dTDP-4-amino-4,6-dideoxygalactose transaminase
MIRLLTPNIPPAESALAYYRKSEEAKHYSNFGPCVKLLEERLSKHYAGAYVVTVANCTLGLELVYTLKMLRGARAIELPALTFPATWLAANRAGLEIIPIDVDPDTWIAPGVAGFGLPSYAPVVDAAGAFGEQGVPILKSGMTAVFSAHATKTLGVGELGWIVTWDADDAKILREMTNFGISGKISIGPGTNAKVSEITAAFALAALDQWDREPWLRLHDWYFEHLPEEYIPQKRPRGVYSLMPVRCPVDPSVIQEDYGHIFETRRWYYPQMLFHPMFKDLGDKYHLPVTDDLAETLLGLPYHLGLTEEDVKTVCECLESSIL